MKKTKKALSLILALLLCLTALSPIASAEPEKIPFKVVAVGDSTSNGLGNIDYGLYARYDYMLTAKGYPCDLWTMHTLGYGFLDTASERAYPYRLAQYIQEQDPGLDVQFTSLAISGIRNTEILAILDPTYKGDSYTECYINGDLHDIAYIYGIENMSDFFCNELKDADLITVDACLNSFTLYLQNRLSSVMAPQSPDSPSYGRYKDTLEDLGTALTPEIMTLIKPLKGLVAKTFDGILTQNQITGAIDTIMYCVASSLANFSGVISRIREINDHARILVAGAYYPIRDKSWVYGDLAIDTGDIMTALCGIIDSYICTVDPNRDNYSFIDMPEDIEVFMEYFAAADTMWDLDPDILRELIDDIFGLNHTTATPLCVAARAEGTARGLDISAYYPLYSDSLYAILENVREKGEDAPEMDRILADTFEKYISYILAGAKAKRIDVVAALDALGNMSYYDVLDIMDSTPVEELSDEQLTRLFILDLSTIENGMMAHFSPRGCDQKYEAALKAYLSGDTAADVSHSVRADFKSNFENSLFGTFVTPLINVLRAALGNILDSLRSLFADSALIKF